MANPITKIEVGGTTYDVKDAGAVRSVNNVSPDANGNVNVDAGGVKTVNGQQPDAAGNVQIETGSETVPAEKVTAGTFAGKVVANANAETSYTTYQVRNAAILSATPSSMTNGEIAFVYS